MRILPLARAGSIAVEIITQSSGTEADVLAVFDRSFYVLTEHGFVCVGMPEIGDGPINALIGADERPKTWADLGVFPEAKVQIAGGRLSFGDDGAIELNATPVWMPAPWRAAVPGWTAAVAQVKRALAAAADPDGLARLIASDGRSASRDVERAAQGPVRDLRQRLGDVLRSGQLTDEVQRAATLLVGLGPGLTPSGDDVLGGMFLALSALGRNDVRDQIWDAIGPELDMLTVPISAMHLACAADGLGAAAMHDLINGIVSADEALMAVALPQVLAYGATSGADAIAGIVLALEALSDCT